MMIYIVILLLIAYFSKVNFYLALVFITIIIIKSIPLYEGFDLNDNIARERASLKASYRSNRKQR